MDDAPEGVCGLYGRNIAIQFIRKFVFGCFAICLSISGTALAVPVTVEVDWPSWSSENQVIIRDPLGAIVQTICDPSNCFVGGVDSAYSNTFNYNFSEDLNYSLEIQDSFGDGWNGVSPVIRIYSDGILVFEDAGPNNGTDQTATFDVAAASSSSIQSCTSFTGAWTGNSATTSSGVGVSISTASTAGGSWDPPGTDALNTINAFSELTAQGHTSWMSTYNWDTTAETATADAHDDTATGTLSVAFDQPVANPVFHFDRIGGSGGTLSNSIRMSLTSTGSLVRLAGPSHFEVSDRFIQRTLYETMSGTSTTESNLNSIEGTAAGSIYVAGNHTNVGFEIEGAGVEGAGGDQFEMVVCADPIVTARDFSDAPGSYGDASHATGGGLYLGTQVDDDTASLASTDALGDDNDNNDDEDGVSFFPALAVGDTSYTLPSLNISANGSGTLHSWIDFDADGSFETGEHSSVSVSSGVLSGDLVWTGLPVMIAGSTFVRLRLTSDSSVTSSAPSTFATDGEVEDYSLAIDSSASGPLTCPAGFIPTSGSGNADVVIVAAQFSDRALGIPETPGTGAANSNSARLRNSAPTLVLDLTDTIPENAIISITMARDTGAGNYAISMSPDNSAYTTVANFNSGTLDVLQPFNVTVPAGGARYVQFQRTAGNIWVGGLEYSQICVAAASLTGSKSVSVWDPGGSGLYAVPGNDVVYSITGTNTGVGATDSNSIVLIDPIPDDLEFYNDDIDDGGPETNPVSFSQTSGAGLSFNYAADVAYSNAVSAPTNFSACSYNPASGYDPNVTFICINPKGALAGGVPNPSFTVSFRGRIQ